MFYAIKRAVEVLLLPQSSSEKTFCAGFWAGAAFGALVVSAIWLIPDAGIRVHVRVFLRPT